MQFMDFMPRRLPQASQALLVIAHPDDETMFFTPTIHELGRQGGNVTVLCLSNGEDASNYEHIQVAILDCLMKAMQATMMAWVV